tara:strand:- start:8124 stop:8471 length:348 start_codon:yes stop_codon:yes gene_type:complete
MYYNFDCDVSYSYSDDDDIYRNNLLKAFNTREMDDTFSNNMDELYNFLIKEKFFKELFEKIKDNRVDMGFTDLQISFTILLSFDYFETFHKCVIDFKNNGLVNDKNKEEIYNIIT